MIHINEVISIHQILIDNYGGTMGIRNLEGLQSAIESPFQTFDGVELYPTIEIKAAAILQSILINHPFIDGNKRVGYTMMRILLLAENKDFQATETEKYNFIIRVASGKMKISTISEWINKRSIQL